MPATPRIALAAWKPTWAVVLAWLVLVPAAGLALYGAYANHGGRPPPLRNPVSMPCL